jgi:GDP/UDP-N,N'-diacetylbacillosamine 2-epimerase (hydrolysing)
VIDCEPAVAAIRAALDRLYSTDFAQQLPHTVNPYGTGGASERILQTLRTISLDRIVVKQFYNWPSAPQRVACSSLRKRASTTTVRWIWQAG